MPLLVLTVPFYLFSFIFLFPQPQPKPQPNNNDDDAAFYRNDVVSKSSCY